EGGGFASAQDADTDHVEGLTFTWKRDGSVPDQFLNIFEGDRFIIRGELDDELRAELLEMRNERPQPARDDKAIASWNGLGLAALAECGRVLDRAGCTAPGAPARPRARATSTTMRTSRTACTSSTSRPASCAGSRSRTASRG